MGIISIPVLRAFFLQALALLLVYLLLQAAWRLAGIQITIWSAALLQGTVAAVISRRYLPSWWLPIQFLLPPALLATHMLALPSWIFLLLFLVLLALYWTTFRTRVPYFPSGKAAWDEVAGLLPAGSLRVIDIGSGFGGAMLHLSRLRPDCRFAGIEIAPLPWLASALRSWARRLRGEKAPGFLRGDYQRLDFGQYDVIFAYLSPAAMPALWEKARSEMRPGSMLLSYEFEIPEAPPHLSVLTGSGRILHGWRM